MRGTSAVITALADFDLRDGDCGDLCRAAPAGESGTAPDGENRLWDGFAFAGICDIGGDTAFFAPKTTVFCGKGDFVGGFGLWSGQW